MSLSQESAAPVSASDQTRLALVRAALQLFGRQGYDGTSTRQIATAAKANIGSIAYHFGGKEGLRMAAADHVVRTIQGVAAPAVSDTEAAMQQLSPDEAHQRLTMLLDRMVSFITAQAEANEIVPFVLRELATPSPALDRIYAGVIEPTHRRLCAIWAAATGEDAESEATKLSVFTMVGQIVYFRIGREAVLRRMGWPTIGPREAGKISTVARRNLDAMLAARRGSKS